MQRALAALTILLSTGLASTEALADFPSDVENARYNALFGGPVSAHDAELVRRWGCSSGTHSPYCGTQGRGYRAYRYKVRR
jgi:hypothetical protein